MVGIYYFDCFCGNNKITMGFCMTGEDESMDLKFGTKECQECHKVFTLWHKSVSPKMIVECDGNYYRCGDDSKLEIINN